MITNVWKKSTKSGAAGHCVEVRAVGSDVQIRDSKAGEQGPVITVTDKQWEEFILQVPQGFSGPLQATSIGDHVISLHGSGVELTFTGAEWDAFVDGVRRGEFDLPLA